MTTYRRNEWRLPLSRSKKIYDKDCSQCLLSLNGICKKHHIGINQYNCPCCKGSGWKKYKNEQWNGGL